ncbi:MAG: efflux RND transporter periplasmic adaptor subunit [Gammaproteobacteria bacterium]|nr:efflux RND transporter periplasmic adaptor subunit [Gammaproteobacteria bacterium]
MHTERPSRWRALWVLPPIAVGVAVVMFMAGGRQPPTKVVADPPSQQVRVIEVPSVELIPYANGYGTVQPEKVWAAVAEVPGRVVETYARLRDGETVGAGTQLFRIDPTDIELQLAQAEAELAELEVQETNARASLDIDQRNLALAQRESRRIAKLSTQGTASQSDVDNAERTMLNARTAVQNTENSLALFPTQRRLLEARLAQAQRDLANTTVHAPFDLRIADLAVEKDQYVGVGQTLFRGDAVQRVEITAQVAISSLRHLFADRDQPIPSIADMPANMKGFTGFRPLVRMDLGDQVAEWEAEFVRFSDEVDPQTRTIGVVVAVDNPLQKAIPGLRPPLSKGMFVQVIIRGHAQANRLVVPRNAIRNGHVYVVDDDNRLQTRTVGVRFNLGAISIIEHGLQAGTRVVVGDLVPAVDGMRLQPVADEATQQALAAAARDAS